MLHEIDISYQTGAPTCNPHSEHVKKLDQVKWKPDATINHWAVVFGPGAPVRPKVLHAGQDTTTIDAKRDFDPHKHKYTILVWTGKKIDYADPELIVDD